ncbi:MAG: hypothetical protein NT099_01460 [Candidatus Saganbacteria bacterium]|nr:hypothetical protein [Candidatus Saganbacteria bacterium]
MAMDKVGFSGSRVEQKLLNLYRLLQAKGRKAALEVKQTALGLKETVTSAFDPLAITPEGFAFSDFDDGKGRSTAPRELTGVQIAYLQAMGPGGGGGGILEVERMLWQYVAVKGYSETAQYRALIHELIKSPINRTVVVRFLAEALNDRVTQLEVAAKLGTTPLPGVGQRYSQSMQVWDVAAHFYLYVEDFDRAIEFSRKLYDSPGVGRDTRLEYAGILGGVLNLKAKKCLREGQDLATVRTLFEEARKYSEICCQSYDKPEIGWYSSLFEANSHLGRHEENWPFIRQALRQFGKNSSVLVSFFLWGALLDLIIVSHGKASKQVVEAVRLFERVEGRESELPANNSTQFAAYRHLMGIPYCLYGNYEKAITYLQLKANWETDPQFVFFMAFAQFKRGNTSEAQRLAGVLKALDSGYRGLPVLEKLASILEPLPARILPFPVKRVAASAPVPAPASAPTPFISGEEFRTMVVGEAGGNIDRIFTADRTVRQFVARKLQDAGNNYQQFLEREEWGTVQSFYFAAPVTLAFSDPELKAVLEILGIEKVEIHPSDSREVRIYLSGQQDKYYKVRIADDLSFGFFESPALREIDPLLRALILEEIVAIVEGGSSFGLVKDALAARPVEVPAAQPTDWAALGRQAKAQRDEAARKAAEAARAKAAEEARLLEQLERDQGITAERTFLSNNKGLYVGLSSAVDAASIDLLREEFNTDQIVATCMAWLGSDRAIDAPVLSFEVPVPEDHLLFPVVKKVTIYGPLRAKEVLAGKNIRPETVAEMGFKEDAPKSAFLGVYDLECVVDGQTRILTAILDPQGQKLSILGLPEGEEQKLLSKTLRRVVLERLAFRTARMVRDKYDSASQTGEIRTEGAEILRGIAVTIEQEMGSPAVRSGKKQNLSQIGSAAEKMELLRIASQTGGIVREPLYVKSSGKYRRVRSDDARYRFHISMPPEKRFVRMRPGMTYRLRLGPTLTPGPKDPARHEPYYWSLNISPEGQIKVEPNWNPLTWERIFSVGNVEMKAKALMPYAIEPGKRSAYLSEGANRLAADLDPTLMVYAVTAYDNEQLVYIPRDLSGKTIGDVQAQLQSRPAQVDFLHRFLAGQVDELQHAAVDGKRKAELRDAGVKRRFLIVMPTNVGYWEGRFWSHDRFNREEAALTLAGSVFPTVPA